jgi:hypothetical protein
MRRSRCPHQRATLLPPIHPCGDILLTHPIPRRGKSNPQRAFHPLPARSNRHGREPACYVGCSGAASGDQSIVEREEKLQRCISVPKSTDYASEVITNDMLRNPPTVGALVISWPATDPSVTAPLSAPSGCSPSMPVSKQPEQATIYPAMERKYRSVHCATHRCLYNGLHESSRHRSLDLRGRASEVSSATMEG